MISHVRCGANDEVGSLTEQPMSVTTDRFASDVGALLLIARRNAFAEIQPLGRLPLSESEPNIEYSDACKMAGDHVDPQQGTFK